MRALLFTVILGAVFLQTSVVLPGTNAAELPLSLLVWAPASLLLLGLQWRRGKLRLPTPQPTQTLFLSLTALALLGLSPDTLSGGLRQFLQYALILGLAWSAAHQGEDDEMAHQAPPLFAAAALLLMLGAATGALFLPPFDISRAKYGALLIAATPFLLLFLNRLDKRALIALPAAGLIVGFTFANAGLIVIWALVLLLGTRASARRAAPFALAGAGCALLVSVLPTPGPSAWEAVRPHYDETHLRRIYIEDRAALLAPRLHPLGAGPGQYKDTINRLKLRLQVRPSPDEFTIPKDSNNQYLLSLVELGPAGTLALLVLILAAATAHARPLGGERQRQQRTAARLALLGLALSGLFCVLLSRGTGVWLGILLGLCTRNSLRTSHFLDLRPLLPWAVPVAVAMLAAFATLRHNTPLDPDQPIASPVNQRVAAALFHTSGYEDRSRLHVIEYNPFTDTETAPDSIRREAENCDSISAPWTEVSANEASGNRALSIPEGAGKGAGSANFKIAISPEEAGDYRFEARVRWLDACGNSLGFSVANQNGTITSSRFGQWHHLQCPLTVTLPAGEHTLRLHNLEDGILIDAWRLQKQ